MTNKTEYTLPITFSVIIPLYNKEESVISTVESVLNQTYSHFELIIVNDGSTDNSLNIVQSVKDKRIRIIDQTNSGVSSARNRGIKEALFEYITFLDADDIWFPNCLQEFCKLITDFPKASVFATNYNISGKNLKGNEDRYYIGDFHLTSAIFMARWNIPVMLTGCVTIQRDCFDLVGIYNEMVTHGEDVDLWNRLADRFTIAKSEVVTTLYRIEAENRASNICENNKLFPVQRVLIKNEIMSKSQQLRYGCDFLIMLVNNMRHHQNLRESIYLLKYWNWIVRAAYLYIRYRCFVNLNRKL